MEKIKETEIIIGINTKIKKIRFKISIDINENIYKLHVLGKDNNKLAWLVYEISEKHYDGLLNALNRCIGLKIDNKIKDYSICISLGHDIYYKTKINYKQFDSFMRAVNRCFIKKF